MIIREGRVQIEVPQKEGSHLPGHTPVFYNPRMHPNRDLSVLMAKYLALERGQAFQAVETHAASGITSLRWHKEAPEAIQCTYSSDISLESVRVFRRNYELNAMAPERYCVYEMDGRKLLERIRTEPVHFIEVDPFGIAIPYVEAAIITLDNGGILSVTNTNLSPLAGSYVNACRRKYTAVPLKNEFKHEIGLRILLKKIIERGAEHDIAMVPVLSVAHQHFYKVFLRKERGARRANDLLNRVGFLFYCPNCLNRKSVVHVNRAEQRCDMCGHGFHYAGPMWLGALVDTSVVEAVYRIAESLDALLHPTTRRILRLLREESRLSVVGYYHMPRLVQKWRLPTQPPLRRVLRWVKGTRTHFAGDGFRTALSHQELVQAFRSHLPVKINVLGPAPWEEVISQTDAH